MVLAWTVNTAVVFNFNFFFVEKWRKVGLSYHAVAGRCEMPGDDQSYATVSKFQGFFPEKGSNYSISTGVVVCLLLVSLLAGSIHLMLK